MALETAPAATVKVSPSVSAWLTRISDAVVAVIPQKTPSDEAIKHCALVGHRGCKDVNGIKENTFDAFDYALNNGMQGIELDLRWTKDQQIVIAHDPDLLRVHGHSEVIAELNFNELRLLCPAVPSLAEVLARYQGQLRFYLELKTDGWNSLARQQQQLLQTLAALQPVTDYYLMSFDLELLKALDQVPRRSKVAIMHSNPSDIKTLMAEAHVGSVGGHYILLNKRFRQCCQQHQVALGVGFPASRNSLYREINHGAIFAFVDDPAKAKAWLN